MANISFEQDVANWLAGARASWVVAGIEISCGIAGEVMVTLPLAEPKASAVELGKRYPRVSWINGNDDGRLIIGFLRADPDVQGILAAHQAISAIRSTLLYGSDPDLN